MAERRMAGVRAGEKVPLAAVMGGWMEGGGHGGGGGWRGMRAEMGANGRGWKGAGMAARASCLGTAARM